MNKIYHIAKREFLIRVQKKSFWLMTFLGPLIMSLLMIVPVWLSMEESIHQNIIITDSSKELLNELPVLPKYNFIHNRNLNLPSDSVLLWFDGVGELRNVGGEFTYLSTKVDPYLSVLLEKSIGSFLSHDITHEKFVLNTTYQINKSESSAVKELLAYGMGISIYFFIFMYGVQVMKGVVEEKTNRIVEVMLCTVKPFEMLMGKILGISLVGFLQFFLWTVLLFVFQSIVSTCLGFEQASTVDVSQLSNAVDVEVINDVQIYLKTISSMNWPLILIGFAWLFLFGFLLFASLFAVVGSASDVDTDTQQFIFPITVPLLGTIVLAQQIVGDPYGTIAKVLSYIPFSSPIAMSMRLPFEGQDAGFLWELILSGLILFVTFIGVVWVASRVYRVGILTYGSKVGYRDLVKWFFVKE